MLSFEAYVILFTTRCVIYARTRSEVLIGFIRHDTLEKICRYTWACYDFHFLHSIDKHNYVLISLLCTSYSAENSLFVYKPQCRCFYNDAIAMHIHKDDIDPLWIGGLRCQLRPLISHIYSQKNNFDEKWNKYYYSRVCNKRRDWNKRVLKSNKRGDWKCGWGLC